MNEEQARALLKKYNEGTATPDEIRQVETYFFRYLKKREAWPDEQLLIQNQAAVRKHLLQQIKEDTQSTSTGLRWPRIAVAASIVLALSFGGYFLLHQQQTQQTAQNNHNDLLPGGNKAILTLANGRQIILTNAKNGHLAIQGQTVVNKTTDGQIAYQAGSSQDNEVTYNTMTTPRGGQYWVTLADGSRALLNAASSLKYPTSFNGKERIVELTGEAYFEVVHNDKQPFKVKTSGQVIEDIGTHFNINAYADEPVVATTLVEGAVKVTAGSDALQLRPGQQARLTSGHLELIKNADVDQVIAWKEGHFSFKDADIKEVMRQFARWYDVEVVYEGDVPSGRYAFNGALHRDIKASQALQILDIFKIRHRIDGKKIIITP